MPPKTAADRFYADRIDHLAQGLGYEAASSALSEEYEKARESTLEQAFHINGALMQDLVDIVEKYPKWGIRFIETKTGVDVKLTAPADDEERIHQKEIVDKIRAAFAKAQRVAGGKGCP